MKKVIKAARSLDNDMRAKIEHTFDVLVVSSGEEFGRGGYVYILKPKSSNNVYRVFVDTASDELIFQQIRTAFYVNGKEYYDDPYDYDNRFGKEFVNRWFDYIVRWVNRCEEQFPNFTRYFDEDDNPIDGPINASTVIEARNMKDSSDIRAYLFDYIRDYMSDEDILISVIKWMGDQDAAHCLEDIANDHDLLSDDDSWKFED